MNSIRSLFLILFIFSLGCSTKHDSISPHASQTVDPSSPANSPSPGTTSSMGGEKGNGAGDHLYSDDTAWFADPTRTIQICYSRATDFDVDAVRVESAISLAMINWGNYIRNKELYRFKQDHPDIATKFKILSACDGSEDLTFEFGTEGKLINEATESLSIPWAYAKRTHYDEEKAWGKGVIWVSSSKDFHNGANAIDWTIKGSLELILLHEVGHSMGVGHIPGTAMREDIARFAGMYTLSKALSENFEGIDQENELAENAAKYTYSGILSVKRESVDNFKLLTDRPPVGNIKALVVRTRNPVMTAQINDYLLLLADDQGKFQFPIQGIKGSSADCGGQNVFKTYKKDQDGEQMPDAGGGYTCYSQLGNLKTVSGKILPVQISHNSIVNFWISREEFQAESVSPTFWLDIRFNDSEQMKNLFISTH